MVHWVNHVTIAAPRNASTSHTVDPASGTVVAGAGFTATAGRLLVCLVEGAVTSTTPAGWTLPSGGSAINNTGLYLWHRTAAGGDTLTTTHNGSNYPVVFDIYEFPAGSTLLAAESAINVASGGAGPSLSGLSATANLRIAAAARGVSNATPLDFTWAAGVTELVDTSAAASGTDGYAYSLAYLQDATGSSFSAAASDSAGSGGHERIVAALNIATTSGSIGGTLAAATPALSIAAPTSVVTGTSRPPVYTATLAAAMAAVTIAVATATLTGTATTPGYAGRLDTDLPTVAIDPPDAAITGTYLPASGATLNAHTPTIAIAAPVAAITGTHTIPGHVGTLASPMPPLVVHPPTASISGVVTVPVYAGTVAATMPGLIVAVPAARITGRNPDNAVPDNITLTLVAEHASTITLAEHTGAITIRERG